MATLAIALFMVNLNVGIQVYTSASCKLVNVSLAPRDGHTPHPSVQEKYKIVKLGAITTVTLDKILLKNLSVTFLGDMGSLWPI